MYSKTNHSFSFSGLFFLAVAPVLLGAKCSSAGESRVDTQSSGNESVWVASDAAEKPESAVFDAETGQVFVSNIAGEPTEKNGQGSIYTLTPDGKLKKQDWATGLDAPKGMRRLGSELLVADIDKIVAFDIETAKKTREIKIQGSKFLNDIAVDEKTGKIYVSDTTPSAIYVIDGSKAEIFAMGPELEHPNGLLIDGDELIVASWGLELKDDWSVSKDGGIYALDVKTKKRRDITDAPLGNLDGLEKTTKGYLVSDWLNGGVIHISNVGKKLKTWAFPQGSADLGYDAKTGLIFVPEMLENKITAIRL